MITAYLSNDTIKELDTQVWLNYSRELRALDPLVAVKPWNEDLDREPFEGRPRPDLYAREVPKWATEVEWRIWKRRWKVEDDEGIPRRTDLSYVPGIKGERIFSETLRSELAPKYSSDAMWSTWLTGARRARSSALKKKYVQREEGGETNLEIMQKMEMFRTEEEKRLEEERLAEEKKRLAEEKKRLAAASAFSRTSASRPERIQENTENIFREDSVEALDPLQEIENIFGEGSEEVLNHLQTDASTCATYPLVCLAMITRLRLERKSGFQHPIYYPAEWIKEKPLTKLQQALPDLGTNTSRRDPEPFRDPDFNRNAKWNKKTRLIPASFDFGLLKEAEELGIVTVVKDNAKREFEDFFFRYYATIEQLKKNEYTTEENNILERVRKIKNLEDKGLELLKLFKERGEDKEKILESLYEIDFKAWDLYQKVKTLQPLQEVLVLDNDFLPYLSDLYEKAVDLHLAVRAGSSRPTGTAEAFLTRLEKIVVGQRPKLSATDRRIAFQNQKKHALEAKRTSISAAARDEVGDPGSSSGAPETTFVPRVTPLHRRAVTVLYWNVRDVRYWEPAHQGKIFDALEAYMHDHLVDIVFTREGRAPPRAAMKSLVPPGRLGSHVVEKQATKVVVYWNKASPYVDLMSLHRPLEDYDLVGGVFRKHEATFSCASIDVEGDLPRRFDALFDSIKPAILVGTRGKGVSKGAFLYSLEAHEFWGVASNVVKDEEEKLSATEDFMSFDPKVVTPLGRLTKVEGSESLANGHHALCARFFLPQM
jgi:hypothetical protein